MGEEGELYFTSCAVKATFDLQCETHPRFGSSFICAVGGLSTAGSMRGQVQLLSTCRQAPCFAGSVVGVRICLQGCGSGEVNNAGKIEGFEGIMF